jgi:hypothetical protein
MSLAAQLIIGLLALIVLLQGYVMLRVVRAVRVLSQKRLEVYSAHLGELHEIMHRLRRQKRPPHLDVNLGAQFNLIASFPTMGKSSEVMAAFNRLREAEKDMAPASAISANEQAAEKALVALNVAMREDLSLNTGPGRFPNAEVFRRRRGQQDKTRRDPDGKNG